MTQDEIILLADASGISLYGMGLDREKFIHHLEAFAKLVAQHEQKEVERLRALCYEMQSELYAYRAANHLKNVTEHIRTKGLT